MNSRSKRYSNRYYGGQGVYAMTTGIECFRCHYGFTREEWAAATVCPQCGKRFNKGGRGGGGRSNSRSGRQSRKRATASGLKLSFASMNRYPLITAIVLGLAGWVATMISPFLLSVGKFAVHFGMILGGLSLFALPALLQHRYMRSLSSSIYKGFEYAFNLALGGGCIHGLGYLMIYVSFGLYVVAGIYAVWGIGKLVIYGLPKVVESFKSMITEVKGSAAA